MLFKFNKKLIVFIIFFIFIHSFGKSKTFKIQTSRHKAGAWTMDYMAAMDYIKKTNKLVLFYFTGSDWNDYCIYLTKNIFSGKAWSQFSKDYLATIYIDFPKYQNARNKIPFSTKRKNKSLLNKYNISFFPTILLLDKDLKLLASLPFTKKKILVL